MYYEINVSLNGKHFFATAERSCTTRREARQVYEALAERFKTSEGFDITISKWESRGEKVDPGLLI